MRLKAFIMFIGVCLQLEDIRSQTIPRLGANTAAGAIIAHSTALKPISQSHPFGFTAAWQRMNITKPYWKVCNCF